MDKLVMHYEFIEDSNNYSKSVGYVSKVTYGEKVLATFNKETGFTDLSVLNPFVGKEVYIRYNDGREEHRVIVNLEAMEYEGRKGHIVNLEKVVEEVE